MISICCCAINSKWDVDIFVRSVHRMAGNFEDFEIVLTHDDRVDDGSPEHFAELQEEFPRLKIVHHTQEQTVHYLRACIHHYRKRKAFRPQFLDALEENVDLFEQDKLFDPRRSFLWLSSGILYNKAVGASSGDNIIVTPGDFVYLFSVETLNTYMNRNKKNGHFYAKPNAVWARVTNLPEEWLRQHVDDVHQGRIVKEGYRWDSNELFRDYCRQPMKLEDMWIPDFRNNVLINLDQVDKGALRRYCNESMKHGGLQKIPGFHGFHAMTRQTFNEIGGFTEEWYGRAFPDDKMTFNGARFEPGHALPDEFCVAWCGQAEVLPYHGPGYKKDWKEKIEFDDPWFHWHPVPGIARPTYLHKGIMENSHIAALVPQTFDRNAPPIRLVTVP